MIEVKYDVTEVSLETVFKWFHTKFGSKWNSWKIEADNSLGAGDEYRVEVFSGGRVIAKGESVPGDLEYLEVEGTEFNYETAKDRHLKHALLLCVGAYERKS
jgi:hypothetical protein